MSVHIYYGPSYLQHHGIKGMKWGRRRWQNADGSLTPAGRSRYADDVREKKAAYKAANKEYRKSISKAQRGSIAGISPTKKHRQVGAANWADAEKKANKANKAEREYKDAKKAYKNTDEYKAKQKDRAKKAAVVGAAVVGTALAAYGAYKVNQYVKDSHVKLQAKRGHDWAEESFNQSVDMAWERLAKNEYAQRVSLQSNSGHEALDSARKASNDNFRTAYRNVRDYRKSGGDVKNLPSVGSYRNNLTGSSIEFTNKAWEEMHKKKH